MRRIKIRLHPIHALWLSLLMHILLLGSFVLVIHAVAKDELPSNSPPPSVPSYLSESPPAPPAPPVQKPVPDKQMAEQKTVAKEQVDKTGIQKNKQVAKKKTRKSYAPPNKNRPIKFSPNAVPEDITHPYDREPLRLVGESKIIKPLIKILARALQQHLRYPRVAADFNLSGVVLVGFVLDSHGYVTEAKVVQSSGAGVLDEAARDAVASMSPVGDVHEYVDHKEFMVVGIIFG